MAVFCPSSIPNVEDGSRSLSAGTDVLFRRLVTKHAAFVSPSTNALFGFPILVAWAVPLVGWLRLWQHKTRD